MDKKQIMWMALLALSVTFLISNFRKAGTEAPASSAAADSTSVEILRPNTTATFGGRMLTAEALETDALQRVRLGSVSAGDWKLELELDPRGAAIWTARLAGEYQEAWQKRRKDKTPEEMRQWSYRVVNAVNGAAGATEAIPYSTQLLLVDEGVIDVTMSGRTLVTTADGSQAPGYVAWEPGEVVREGNVESVDFTLNVYDSPAAERKLLYRLVKRYSLAEGSYNFRMSVRVENHTAAARSIALVQFGPAGLPREGLRMDMRDVVVGAYVADSEAIEVPKKGKITRDDLVKHPGRRVLGTNVDAENPAVWAAAGNQFFGSILYPTPAGLDLAGVGESTPVAELVPPAADAPFTFFARLSGQGDAASQLVVQRTSPRLVAPGAALECDYDVFCGPKGNNLFDRTALYNKLGYRGAITFRSCTFCLFEPLARGVMWIIENGGRALGNYGVIIILLVFVIRLCLHPITRKSQVSMMKMKDMQPEMKRLQEKYKDDKEALQRAMMDFWKKTGFTPVLGCAPMLIQMPIWIALWSGLSASGVLRHEGLLPFWITDLAGPDTVIAFSHPYTLPLIGGMVGPVHGLNILPLLLTVAMFLQQKFTPSTAAPGSDQEKQQKMMMWMMSLMMMLFFYNAPSGLTLYIMASTASGVVESWVIRRHLEQKRQLDAAAETIVNAPGKAARDQRPKKPKPPFKNMQ